MELSETKVEQTPQPVEHVVQKPPSPSIVKAALQNVLKKSPLKKASGYDSNFADINESILASASSQTPSVDEVVG